MGLKYFRLRTNSFSFLKNCRFLCKKFHGKKSFENSKVKMVYHHISLTLINLILGIGNMTFRPPKKERLKIIPKQSLSLPKLLYFLMHRQFIGIKKFCSKNLDKKFFLNWQILEVKKSLFQESYLDLFKIILPPKVGNVTKENDFISSGFSIKKRESSMHIMKKKRFIKKNFNCFKFQKFDKLVDYLNFEQEFENPLAQKTPLTDNFLIQLKLE